MKIAFLGLGSMGSPIAQNLLKAGHNLTIFNRTRQRAETLAQYGAKVAESASEAVTGAEIAITMLADDSAVEAVVLRDTRLLNSLPHEAIHISMSTISVALAERLTQAHTERGQGFISSPVFGRPEAAEQQKLFVVTAGPQQLLQK